MARGDFDAGAVRPAGEPSSARLFDPNDEGPWRGSAGEVVFGPAGISAVGYVSIQLQRKVAKSDI